MMREKWSIPAKSAESIQPSMYEEICSYFNSIIMNLNELIKSKTPNLQLVIGITDLKEFAIEIVDEVLSQNIEKEKEEKYLTTRETANKIGCDISTLWRWNKAGYLSSIKVGGKVRYRESDIRKVMEG